MTTIFHLRFYLALVFLFFAMVTSSHVLAGREVPKVSVVASAMQAVEPDQVRWQLALRSEGKDSSRLAQEHADNLASLLAFLKEQGIAEKSIQTEQMRLSENWNYQNGKRFKQGYVANSALRFVSDIPAYTGLWQQLAGFEGLSVNGSTFEVSDRLVIQREVRKQALLAARDKAREMAETLGVSIGKPILIEDMNWEDDVQLPRAEMALMSRSAAKDIVAPGTEEIRMRVRVDFAIR